MLNPNKFTIEISRIFGTDLYVAKVEKEKLYAENLEELFKRIIKIVKRSKISSVNILNNSD